MSKNRSKKDKICPMQNRKKRNKKKRTISEIKQIAQEIINEYATVFKKLAE